VRRGVQIKIVGDEPLAASRLFLLFDNRMSAFHNFQIARFVQLGAAVVSQCSSMRIGGKHIDFGKGQRGLPDALCFARDRASQLRKQAALNFDDLLLRIEDLCLVFLQLGGREALSIHQRLLAFVIRRNQMKIGLGDLEVITEDRVELHLER